MEKDFDHTFKRLDKVKRTIENLFKQNQDLSKANKALRQFRDTTQAHWNAELRVARKEIEKQVREEDRATAKES